MTSLTIPSAPLTINDFRPCCNGWHEDTSGIKVNHAEGSTSCKVFEIIKAFHSLEHLKEGSPLFIIDKSTGHRYINTPKERLRDNNFVTMAVSILSLPTMILNISVMKTLRVVSFYHFWKDSEVTLTLSDRLKSTAADIARVVALPLAILGLTLSPVYGLISPRNGEKMFTSIQRAFFNEDDGHYPISEEAFKNILESHSENPSAKETEDKSPSPQLTINDFRPCCNGWYEDTSGIRVEHAKNSITRKVLESIGQKSTIKNLKEGSPLFIIDKSTGHRYINIPKKSLRYDNFAHILTSIFMLPITVFHIALKIFRVVSFYHFRKDSEVTLTLSDKLKSTAADIACVVASPLAILGLTLFPLYGLIFPHNGIKLLTSTQRAFFNEDDGHYPISEKALKSILENHKKQIQ